MVMAVEVLMLFRSDVPLDPGTKVFCLLLTLIALIEIRILQGQALIFQKLGWALGIGLALLLIPQLFIPETVLLLWNFSLAVIALLSGLVMFAMVGESTVVRAFVIFLTLCVALLMILEFASPLAHKIALGTFVTGALICIHLMTTARQR